MFVSNDSIKQLNNVKAMNKAELIELLNKRESVVVGDKILAKKIEVESKTDSGIFLPESFTSLSPEGDKRIKATKHSMIRFIEIVKCSKTIEPDISVGSICEIVPIELKFIESDIDGLLIIDSNMIIRIWNAKLVE